MTLSVCVSMSFKGRILFKWNSSLARTHARVNFCIHQPPDMRQREVSNVKCVFMYVTGMAIEHFSKIPTACLVVKTSTAFMILPWIAIKMCRSASIHSTWVHFDALTERFACVWIQAKPKPKIQVENALRSVNSYAWTLESIILQNVEHFERIWSESPRNSIH